MKKVLRLPEGFRDLLPVEAGELLAIKEKLFGVYENYGYSEIIPPTVEYDEVFSGAGSERFGESVSDGKNGSTLRFIDRSGSILALRPDMTAPIARIVATKMQAAALPMRLSYFGPVYRENESGRGQQREFLQSGIELIGSNSNVADIEVIMLAIKGCLALGLSDFKLILSDAELITGMLGLIDQGGDISDITNGIRNALISGDQVTYEALIDQTPADKSVKKIFKDLPDAFGDKAILKKMRGRLEKAMTGVSASAKPGSGSSTRRALQKPWLEALSALDRLNRLADMVEMNGWGEYVSFDLGLVRNFNYYNGMVFEIYVPGIGSPIGGGGRYDGLFPRFEAGLSAAGFAIEVERLHIALRERGFTQITLPKCAFFSGDLGVTGFDDIAMHYREKGYRVLLDVTEKGSKTDDLRSIMSRGAAKNADIVVLIDNAGNVIEHSLSTTNPGDRKPRAGAKERPITGERVSKKANVKTDSEPRAQTGKKASVTKTASRAQVQSGTKKINKGQGDKNA